MDAAPSSHPTEQTLSSFGLGKLDDRLAKVVNQHLEQCPDCRQRVAEMSADSFLGRVRDAQAAGKPPLGQSLPSGLYNVTGTKSMAPPPAETLPPGLADHPDYEIKQELGRGGMGVVYLAHNKLMGRDEVLKVMSRHLMERPGIYDRFLREIRAVATLRHPNIVMAYHATRVGESIVFTMEYVEGLDLARMVKAKGPLQVAYACNFICQAARGLQHAHEKGMVHRDIKPGNMMLAPKGDRATIKILDFGLAKVTREQKVDAALTSQGQALGTPDFIAPEQIVDAQSADIRADIYSLGGTLYYLLAGRPPFEADSLYDMYQAHMSRDAEPLNFVRPEVPTELAALVAKMMAKDPARRFQTPAEVAEALTPFFKKGSQAISTPPAQVSQSGQRAAARPAAVAALAPRQTATPPPAPAIPAATSAQPPAPGATWQSLTDGKGTTGSKEATPNFGPSRRPPWAAWPMITAASVLGLAALGIIVVTIRTKNGETTITAPDDKAFKIEKDGVIVEHDPSKVNATPPGRRISSNGRSESPQSAHGPAVKPAPHAELSPRTKAIHQALERPLAMNFADETPLEDILKYIKQATTTRDNNSGVPIYVDPVGLQEAEKSMTSTIKIEIDGKPLSATLPLVLGQLGLAHCVKDDLLFISSPERVASELKSVAVLSLDDKPDTKSVMDALEKPISMSFAEPTPLEDILKYIKQASSSGANASGIQIFVNEIGLQEAEKSMTSTITIDLEGVPLKTSLRHLLKQLGLGYFVKEGILHITSIESVEQQLKGPDAPKPKAEGSEATGAGEGQNDAAEPGEPGGLAGDNPAAANAGQVPGPGTIKNSIGMTFKLIPPGEFMMGSSDDDSGARDDEKPQHQVRITRPFYLGATEVTVGQFRSFVDATGYKTDAEKDAQGGFGFNEETKKVEQYPRFSWRNPGFEQTDEHPVVIVSRTDAVAFADWLSTKEGKTYRLPTEAEWEYACRAKTTTKFSSGDDPESLAAVGNIADETLREKLPNRTWAIAARDGYIFSAPVGRFQPNAFGLRDMHGNVNEWCSDGYDADYYKQSPADDPPGASAEASWVCRGGDMGSGPDECRSAYRRRYTPSRPGMIGFRLVLVPSDH